jgi:hypothetical protein
MRPDAQQRGHQRGELASVLGHRQAAVVAQVKRRQAERSAEFGAMVVPLAPPLPVVHAQPVQQHQHTLAGARKARRQGAARQHQRLAVAAQLHALRQRISGGRQMVAQHAVERGHHGVTARAARAALDRLGQQAQQGRGAQPDPAGDAVHAAIDQPRQATRALIRRTGQRALDARMHGLDQTHQRQAALGGQTGRPLQVGRHPRWRLHDAEQLIIQRMPKRSVQEPK